MTNINAKNIMDIADAYIRANLAACCREATDRSITGVYPEGSTMRLLQNMIEPVTGAQSWMVAERLVAEAAMIYVTEKER